MVVVQDVHLVTEGNDADEREAKSFILTAFSPHLLSVVLSKDLASRGVKCEWQENSPKPDCGFLQLLNSPHLLSSSYLHPDKRRLADEFK